MQTTIDSNGFANYRRKDDGRYVIKNGIALDNRFVVPYNRDLVVRYQAHINVEWCNKSRAIKYLFKYINKGPDRVRATLEDIGANDTQRTSQIDEIKNYLDCRYISAHEAI